MTNKEVDSVLGYIKIGAGIYLGNGKDKLLLPNIITIDAENPIAELIVDFKDFVCWGNENGETVRFDSIIMCQYLRKQINPVEYIRKAYNVLKDGGHLIIIETHNWRKADRHLWRPPEMEGFLTLFSKYFFIECKKQVEGEDSYVVVLRKQGVENVK